MASLKAEVADLTPSMVKPLDTEQPPSPALSENSSISKDEDDFVDFDRPNDPENPINWSRKYKISILALISLNTFIANLAVLMCAPAAPQIMTYFSSTNKIYTTMIISIWEIGMMFGPIILAPLSEIYGRVPIYHFANTTFMLFSLGCAFSNSLEMLIAFRFLTGLMVISPSINPPIVGDMYVKEERGRAMSVMGLVPLIANAAGPPIGGFVASTLGWRWIFYLLAIAMAVSEILLFVFLRESYKVKILRKKTERLRKETGDETLKSQYEVLIPKRDLIRRSVLRPSKMLGTQPVVVLVALYVALLYGTTYLVVTNLAMVFHEQYGFEEGPIGLTFLGIGIGLACGVLFCGLTLDFFLKRHPESLRQPEHRLPPLILASILSPIGLFIYGWTSEFRLHYLLPILGTAFQAFALSSSQITSSNYLVDSFEIYAASAIAASMVMRYCAAAVLPLVGPLLYERLGLGWGNSVLAFAAVAFLPIPIVLIRCGERLRGKAARDL